jgi:hypothetical protein
MTLPGVNKEFIKAQIDGVRELIGRDVTIYYPTTEACSICVASGYLDTVSDTSWYFNCPECAGKYWRRYTKSTDILARVHWVSNEGITATPGGKYFLGDAQITVDPEHRELLESAQSEQGKVVVDGQDFSIIRINPLGAPEINRVRAILKSVGLRPDLG